MVTRLSHTSFEIDITEEPLIRPKLPKKGVGIPDTCILSATRKDFEDLVAKSGLDRFISMFSSRLAYSEKKGFCAAGPFLGAPYAAILMENLAAWGVKRFVFWGWCGSIAENLKIGDILIPESAFAGDGTSSHYLLPGSEIVSASKELSGLLMEGCRQAGCECLNGSVWTMDAIYRETPGKIKIFHEKGAVAVDMETAALFSVSSFLGTKTAAILTVSDDLSAMVWKPGFSYPRFSEAGRRVSDMLHSLFSER